MKQPFSDFASGNRFKHEKCKRFKDLAFQESFFATKLIKKFIN